MRSQPASAASTLTELDGIGPSTGSVISDSVLGKPSAYLAKLDAASVVDPGVGGPIRELLKGDCHSHTHLVRRRRDRRADGPGSDGPRPRVPGRHRPLPPPHDRPRTQSGATARPARRDRRGERAARTVPDPDGHGGRHPRRRQPRSARRAARPPRRGRRVGALEAVHAGAGDDTTNGHGGRQPARRHPRALHRPQGRRHRSGAVEVRRRPGVRRVRPVRHRGRDQLPSRASGPARGAARPGARVGLPGSRSTPTPTRRVSSSGSPTAATRRSAAGWTRSASSTPGARRS